VANHHLDPVPVPFHHPKEDCSHDVVTPRSSSRPLYVCEFTWFGSVLVRLLLLLLLWSTTGKNNLREEGLILLTGSEVSASMWAGLGEGAHIMVDRKEETKVPLTCFVHSSPLSNSLFTFWSHQWINTLMRSEPSWKSLMDTPRGMLY
jgi:hypothetical protein